MPSKHVSVADLQQRLRKVFTAVCEQGKAYYITDNGRAKAVILNIDRYHAMMDALEDFGELESAEDSGILQVIGRQEAG